MFTDSNTAEIDVVFDIFVVQTVYNDYNAQYLQRHLQKIVSSSRGLDMSELKNIHVHINIKESQNS